MNIKLIQISEPDLFRARALLRDHLRLLEADGKDAMHAALCPALAVLDDAVALEDEVRRVEEGFAG